MTHDPVQDHIFGDPDEGARPAPAELEPRRRVPFAGMFGAFDAVRDHDLTPDRGNGVRPRGLTT